MTSTACPTCGRPLDEHNRHVRFGLPEPVLMIPKEERPARTWGNDVLMQVEGVGAFVRILVPIKLTGGHTITYGAWLSVHPDDLRHAWEIWNAPAYRNLRLHGVLANMLPRWESETYGKPLETIVLNVDHVPYAVDSSDELIRRVLLNEWPHELLLDVAGPTMTGTARSVDCRVHGRQAETFVCRHIVDSLHTRVAVGFHWPASAIEPLPNAWCSECERARVHADGDWTDEVMSIVSAQLLCGACYDVAKDIWQQAQAAGGA